MHHSTLKTLAGFLAVKEREETREMREWVTQVLWGMMWFNISSWKAPEKGEGPSINCVCAASSCPRAQSFLPFGESSESLQIHKGDDYISKFKRKDFNDILQNTDSASHRTLTFPFSLSSFTFPIFSSPLLFFSFLLISSPFLSLPFYSSWQHGDWHY